ncbi:hypothetical protein [Thermoleptolyngbya sp. M55_K2018_002]|nr:hypothetical protein [Thermoleptolyngbya sp. M55_K2018_002]
MSHCSPVPQSFPERSPGRRITVKLYQANRTRLKRVQPKPD